MYVHFVGFLLGLYVSSEWPMAAAAATTDIRCELRRGRTTRSECATKTTATPSEEEQLINLKVYPSIYVLFSIRVHYSPLFLLLLYS